MTRVKPPPRVRGRSLIGKQFRRRRLEQKRGGGETMVETYRIVFQPKQKTMPKRGIVYKSPERFWMFVTETYELTLGKRSCFLRGGDDHGNSDD